MHTWVLSMYLRSHTHAHLSTEYASQVTHTCTLEYWVCVSGHTHMHTWVLSMRLRSHTHAHLSTEHASQVTHTCTLEYWACVSGHTHMHTWVLSMRLRSHTHAHLSTEHAPQVTHTCTSEYWACASGPKSAGQTGRLETQGPELMLRLEAESLLPQRNLTSVLKAFQLIGWDPPRLSRIIFFP